MNTAAKRIDLVVPVFNEEAVLPALLDRLAAVFDGLPGYGFRALLVDDGSADRSRDLVRERAGNDPRFELVELSRNFGHQAAIGAGLAAADADAVIFLDADLQDPPEIIPQLVAKWKEGAEIVRAERVSRKETGLRGIGFRLFHRFFKRLSEYPIPANSGTFSLLDRQTLRKYSKSGNELGFTQAGRRTDTRTERIIELKIQVFILEGLPYAQRRGTAAWLQAVRTQRRLPLL